MDSVVKLYMERAENELVLAESLFLLSSDENLQREKFKLEKHFTFYSAVISHAYYCIFYSAKAVLLLKNIKTEPPNEHKKTLKMFKKYLVDTGFIDISLLKIYKTAVLKADALLHIFSLEKSKRGHFTYQRLPQANKEPAEESLKNAKTFFKNINVIIE